MTDDATQILAALADVTAKLEAMQKQLDRQDELLRRILASKGSHRS